MKKPGFLGRFLIVLLILSGCYDSIEEVPEPNEEPAISVLPSVPKGIVASPESSNSIIISWTIVPNADGYNIYRSLYSAGYYQKIYTTTENSYTDINLLADTSYYYKVSAFNDEGESPQSNNVSARSHPAAPTEAPANITAPAMYILSNSIQLNWKSIGSYTYIVYRSLTESGDYIEIASFYSFLSEVRYTDTGLSPDTTYYYKVAISNISGPGPQSAAVSVKTLDENPYAPSSITVYNASFCSIIVSWPSGPNAEEYYVYRSSDNFGLGEYACIGSSSSVSYIDRGLDANTTYYYKVSSVNSRGESDLSSKWGSGKTFASNAGSSIPNAIEITALTAGDFPDGVNELWYKFTRTGAGKLYAYDRTAADSFFTGDIGVDVYLTEGIIITIDNIPLFERDIGKGPNDAIQGSNWNGTYYVKVKPRFGYASNRGTFQLRFLSN